MGNKYNLIDLGKISEPVAGVVNNFIDKISNAVGFIVTPKDIKPAIIEAHKSIIKEIANRQDINPIERAAFISNYKKILKEYKNQVDIMSIAKEKLNPNAAPEKVNDDWITFFFDKAKNVTEDYMKEVWGRILAEEFNEPNTFTKQFLHNKNEKQKNKKKVYKKSTEIFYKKAYKFYRKIGFFYKKAIYWCVNYININCFLWIFFIYNRKHI